MAYEDLCYPIHWGKAKSGMQMRNEGISGIRLALARWVWRRARDCAALAGDVIHTLGVHKSIPNRLIEPFTSIKVVITATNYDNAFALRCHETALPDIQHLFVEMLRLLDSSTPKQLQWGEWHIPYIEDFDPSEVETAIKSSTAKCARVSYFTHDNKESTQEQDFMLHDGLLMSYPVHASPSEHQAQAVPGRHANLTGYRAYRKSIPNEYIEKIDRKALLEKYNGRKYII